MVYEHRRLGSNKGSDLLQFDLWKIPGVHFCAKSNFVLSAETLILHCTLYTVLIRFFFQFCFNTNT